MTTYWRKARSRWWDAAIVLLAAWLFVSPTILGYARVIAPAWNAYMIGLVAAAVAAGAIYDFRRWEEWFHAAIGLWLIASPWLLGFSAVAAPAWNALAVGAGMLALALWATIAAPGRGRSDD